MSEQTPADQPSAEPNPRRNFLVKGAAVVVGTIVGLVPMLAGTMTFLDPLLKGKKKSQSADGESDDGYLPVTSLKSLASDGTPRMFPVIADLQDAWNKFPNTEIGSVYLWQTADGKVECFNARCPHLGCTVNYKPDQSAYVCPCHDSAFSLDGERSNEIPPRNMDPLSAEIRHDDEVWVKFQKFRAGIHERQVV